MPGRPGPMPGPAGAGLPAQIGGSAGVSTTSGVREGEGDGVGSCVSSGVGLVVALAAGEVTAAGWGPHPAASTRAVASRIERLIHSRVPGRPAGGDANAVTKREGGLSAALFQVASR